MTRGAVLKAAARPPDSKVTVTNPPSIDLTVHHKVAGLSDSIAFGFTKTLRFCADTFFAKRYGHRAVVLETVAAVPGMVGATLTHLNPHSPD